MNLQPMETAPWDMSSVILTLAEPYWVNDSRIVMGYFDPVFECWYTEDGGKIEPTHWQPPPVPPAI